MNLISKNLPNILSTLRIILSFVLIPLILNCHFFASILLFAIASVSDFLDGYCARKFNIVSELGAKLDPLADKILMTISYFLLAYIKFIPIYVSLIVIGRDLIILGMIFICRLSNIKLSINPLMSSKINTTIQLVFIIVVLACKLLLVDVAYILDICSFVVCVSTFISGIEYAQKYYWIKNALFK
ncbi:MAG: CDP-alcohol phosphatidyltransferase family protein [Holosporaceae bacterium]|jgi:cardiolipin synthase|nr:CDP-alcohol phosphatidyltransferase family protein [Holosporaceae bacterium]